MQVSRRASTDVLPAVGSKNGQAETAAGRALEKRTVFFRLATDRISLDIPENPDVHRAIGCAAHIRCAVSVARAEPELGLGCARNSCQDALCRPGLVSDAGIFEPDHAKVLDLFGIDHVEIAVAVDVVQNRIVMFGP